jgi:hypothetical protein
MGALMRTIICPHCSVAHELPESAAKSTQTCSECGQQFTFSPKADAEAATEPRPTPAGAAPRCTGTLVVQLVLMLVGLFHLAPPEDNTASPVVAVLAFIGIAILYVGSCLRIRLWRIEDALYRAHRDQPGD